jgi:hypothetical protein
MTETTTLSLAEQARANYEKFVEDHKAEVPDIYDELVEIIKDVSSKGSFGLSMFVSTEPSDHHVELDEPEYYFNTAPHVYISAAANKGIKQLADRLHQDGFKVKMYNHTNFGETIDTIMWATEV